MEVPKGEHEITFKFEPKIVSTAGLLNLVGLLIFVWVVLGSIIYNVKNKK